MCCCTLELQLFHLHLYSTGRQCVLEKTTDSWCKHKPRPTRRREEKRKANRHKTDYEMSSVGLTNPYVPQDEAQWIFLSGFLYPVSSAGFFTEDDTPRGPARCQIIK